MGCDLALGVQWGTRPRPHPQGWTPLEGSRTGNNFMLF